MTLADLQALLETEDEAAAEALARNRDFGRQDWVLVYRWDVDTMTAGDSQLAVFLTEEEAEHARRDAGHDHSPGQGNPGFVSYGDGDGGFKTEWELVGAGDTVPLLHVRHLNAPFPKVVELAEDFRLAFDLHHDRDARQYVTLDSVGDTVVVARFDGQDLYVAKRFLRRYQAARQLHLSLQFCVDRWGGADLAHLDDVNLDIDEDGLRVLYHGGNGRMLGPDRHFTRLVGKLLVPPPPLDTCGIAPYDDEPYETFIVGTDADGNPETFTCDPDQLANYFGKNPDAPHYLTPVFFKPEVMAKYYADPDRYKVQDGYLSAEYAFGLRLDNGRQDQIVVFLGDLGTDLPLAEQQYWRAYNTPPGERMSETGIRRSFLGQWVSSDRVEHRFQAAFSRLNNVWRARHGWPLYADLAPTDTHLLDALHVPTNPSLSEFRKQLVGLAMLVVGYLNESAIVEATPEPDLKDQGIAKLDRYLTDSDQPATVCIILRRIQGARSKLGAHRTSSTFDLAKLLDGSADPPALFVRYLEDLIAEFDALTVAIDPDALSDPRM